MDECHPHENDERRDHDADEPAANPGALRAARHRTGKDDGEGRRPGKAEDNAQKNLACHAYLVPKMRSPASPRPGRI